MRHHGLKSRAHIDDVDFIGLCDLALLPDAELLPVQALEFLESLTSDPAVKLMEFNVPSRGQPSSAPAPSSTPATEGLFQEDSVSLDISMCTPSEALKRLSNTVNNIGQENWAKRARMAAILGNCPKSLKSMRSGAKVPLSRSHSTCVLLSLQD